MKYIPIIVPCAGKGSRSGLSFPKPLFIYEGKTILESIIEKSIKTCEQLDFLPIFIIVIKDDKKQFLQVLDSILDESDFLLVTQLKANGTADAVLKALFEIKRRYHNTDRCALIWCDCIGFRSETLEASIIEVNNYDVTVPGFYTEDCYTAFALNKQNLINLCYETKEIEHKVEGYTDIGVFAFRYNKLLPFLIEEVSFALEVEQESSFINALSRATSKIDCFFLDVAEQQEKKGFNSPHDLEECI